MNEFINLSIKTTLDVPGIHQVYEFIRKWAFLD